MDNLNKQKEKHAPSAEGAAVEDLSTIETVRAIVVQTEHLIQKQFEPERSR